MGTHVDNNLQTAVSESSKEQLGRFQPCLKLLGIHRVNMEVRMVSWVKGIGLLPGVNS